MKEQLKRVGSEATYFVDGLGFTVIVIDVRSAFGRIDYEIKPISGSGSKWVSEGSLRFGNE